MVCCTRNVNPCRCLSLSAVIVALSVLFNCSVVVAEENPVPPGFQIMSNGDIKVKDPSKAVAPAGYHISKWGELVKNRQSVSTGVDTNIDVTTDTNVSNTVTASAEPAAIPPGFHRMENGDIMANDPSKAVVPEGYRLTEGGVLKALTDDSPDPIPVPVTETTMELQEIPPGFHRMPDGTLMANNPSKAVAPPGYHLMPDGTLMAAGASSDHSIHSHKGGGMWMAEYKFERMYMDGLLDTTTDVSPQEIIDPTSKYPYRMSPTDMTMDMHMFMFMYHSTKYMVMGMLHYMSSDMGMIATDGTESTMKSSGIGDTVITVNVPWRYKLDYTVGLSLPTGSIDERGPMTHMQGPNGSTDEPYPYGMQLGSGTYDVILGIGYENSHGDMHWGAGYELTVRTGTNDRDYTLGDKMNLDGWLRLNVSSTVNAEARLDFREIGRISGVDAELDPLMSPVADADNYGGRRLDLGFGVKYETPQMSSVGVDLTLPIYQNLFGPQMKTEWILGLRTGFMF